MKVKYQGLKVKSVGTHGKALSEETHVKYQSPSTYHSKDNAKVKVLNK
jgi:hypothetical protein